MTLAERYREALKDIANPQRVIDRNRRKGESIDPIAAALLLNDVGFLQGIARQALIQRQRRIRGGPDVSRRKFARSRP